MPRNKYPEETRKRILKAAAVVFVEKGYEESTILDIVAATDGLTRGAFYHHFKSKEEVLSAISDMIFAEKNPFEAAMRMEGLNGFQKLQLAVKLNLTDFEDEYKSLRQATAHLLRSPSFLAEHINFNADAAKRWIQPLIEEGVRDGSLKVENPRLIAELFTLLFSIWIPPTMFSGDDAYMWAKAEFAIALLAEKGLPIFDEELEQIGEQTLAALQEHSNLIDKLEGKE
ncbi:MAG: TetR/AcrR family transcriptional regulator [Defluviitaleaceae bacterium]|nr:TetR/AcrR family transcriptional regulator [Defluviitaleaceae bacterium]